MPAARWVLRGRWRPAAAQEKQHKQHKRLELLRGKPRAAAASMAARWGAAARMRRRGNCS
jgi:hypothetical protein